MDSKKTNSRRDFIQNSVMAASAFTIIPGQVLAKQDDYFDTGNKAKKRAGEITLFVFDDHSIPL